MAVRAPDPGAAGPQNLPRAVGVRRAKEIVLTGKPFSAQMEPLSYYNNAEIAAAVTFVRQSFGNFVEREIEQIVQEQGGAFGG